MTTERKVTGFRMEAEETRVGDTIDRFYRKELLVARIRSDTLGLYHVDLTREPLAGGTFKTYREAMLHVFGSA